LLEIITVEFCFSFLRIDNIEKFDNVYGLGPAGTPARGGSPGAFSPRLQSRARGVLSITQLYTEYTEAKAELETESRRNEH